MEKEDVCLSRVHCCSATGNEILSVAREVGQDDTMSGEINQTQKDKHFVTGKFEKLELTTES